MNEVKLTSVKVITELYKKFKNKTIDDEFSLQKLVNRTLDKFVHDEEFCKEISMGEEYIKKKKEKKKYNNTSMMKFLQ